MPRKQRTRLTGCTATHWERYCRTCARIRAVKARRRRRLTEPLPRTEPARQEVAARAYVWSYLRRASITPATCCERCGASSALSFFHPDPAAVREVVWLCKSCRKRVRATGEPVTLTWVWPGQLGEPRKVVPVERPQRRPRRDRPSPSSPPEPVPATPRRAPSAAELAAAQAAAEAADDERYRAQADAFAAIDALNARIAGDLAALSRGLGAKRP